MRHYGPLIHTPHIFGSAWLIALCVKVIPNEPNSNGFPKKSRTDTISFLVPAIVAFTPFGEQDPKLKAECAVFYIVTINITTL